MRHVVIAGVCALVWAGCDGGESTDPGDTATEGDVGDDGGDVVEEVPEITINGPEPAALPVLTPCPAGWREMTDEPTDLVWCEPWPEGGRQECEDWQAHYPGETGCVDVGGACPAGDFAEDLPTDREIAYVLAGATGGDGTEGSPYATIQQAYDETSAGAVIAVGKGEYDECVEFESYRTVWGACAESTLVTCDVEAQAYGVLHGRDTDLEVKRVTLGGARPGISSMLGARVDLEGVVVSDATVVGITVGAGSEVTGSDVLVAGTQSDAEGNFGTGLQVIEGGSMTLERAAVLGNTSAGLLAAYVVTTVDLTDVVIADTQPKSDRDNGLGVDVGQGPHVTMTRVVIEDNHMVGVRAQEPISSVTMTDCVVRRTLSRQRDLGHGLAFNINTGASLTLEKVLVSDHLEHSMIFLQGAIGTLTDLAVMDTAGRERDDMFGRGINIQSDSPVDGTRVLIARAHEVGFFVSGGVGEWQDLTVLDTDAQVADGDAGRGIQVSDEAAMTMLRVLLERNTEIAMLTADDGTDVDIEDLIIRDTRCAPLEQDFGHGLQIVHGSDAHIVRSLFEGNREAAVLVGGANAYLRLEHVTVRGTVRSACWETTCVGAGGGMGITSIGGGYINVSNFDVYANFLCGVQLAHGVNADGVGFTDHGSMDIQMGYVASQPIGANIQAETFDLERISEDVYYVDNERNLDSSYLPVPPPGL